MKKFLLSILYIARQLLNPFFHFRERTILCYHSISDAPLETAVAVRAFKAHLAVLKRKGYEFVSLADMVSLFDGNSRDTISRKVVALTFDDGYADFKTAVLPILEEQKIPATLFIVGNGATYASGLEADIAMLTENDVTELAKHPLIDIGWHTVTHPNLALCDTDILRYECTPPAPVRFFAYPGGNYSDAAVEAVTQAGFTAAFSIKRDLVSRGKSRWLLPRIVVLNSDTEHDVVQYISIAQHWYAVLRGVLRKYG